MMSIEQIATDILKAYDRVHTGDWVKLTEVAGMAGDLSIEQWRAGMQWIMVNRPEFEVMGEINQKTLTDMDRLYEIRCGGQWNHLIMKFR